MNVRRSRPQIFLLSVSYTESAIFETQTHTLLISLKTVAYRSLDTESSCTLRNTHTTFSARFRVAWRLVNSGNLASRPE